MNKTSRSMTTAMVGAAAVTAQLVTGKATRDALFLGALDLTALPAMLMATSVCSIVFIGIHARLGRRLQPDTLVPLSFVASGLLLLAEWMLTTSRPAAAAILIYLHISGAGPLLASGFWLVSSEQFDPRSAKRRFGQVAAAGTLGGLLSAVIAERIAATLGATAMLPVLAGFQFVGAVLVRRLATTTDTPAVGASTASEAQAPSSARRSGLSLVIDTPYLRALASLVLLGTTAAALVDYLFKAGAVDTFGRGDNLLRFFAAYYAATSVVTFLMQMLATRYALDRFGLGRAASTPAAAMAFGCLAGFAFPGFGTLLVARGSESILRGSLYRTGYELFYTPMAPEEKRAAKSIIDVAFDRLGDAVGGGLVRIAGAGAPFAQVQAILAIGFACSAGAVFAASRLNGGYLRTLEASLISRGRGLDLTEVEDIAARAAMLKSIAEHRSVRAGRAVAVQERAPEARTVALDSEMQDMLRLRSRDRARVIDVLSREEGLSAALVPHVIALLAWESVAEHALFALRKVAEEHVGALADALIDPNQEFTVRRRLARVFSVCVSQRAADGVLLGLDDARFDVRYQSARSLAAILDKNRQVSIDRDRVFGVVLREATVGRPVWESRRLLEERDAADAASPLDVFVRGRAGASLAHVFTLLSLVLPREPLQIAFRSLQTSDRRLQGTALEYLEGVLPDPIRKRLWPFLEPTRVPRLSRPREEVIADLLRSNLSIVLNLEELNRHGAFAAADPTVQPS